jgi:predicted GIY-YIG superfamily endonuclease
MYYVYILRSINYPNQIYIGRTVNLKQRLDDHNYGESVHTAKYRPWRLESYFAFSEEPKAVAFEKYLKSGSGREFTRRHF